MSDKPIGEIVGRQDNASASTASETGAASGAGDSASTKTGETSAASGATEVPDIAGLKSALDKERDARSRFEKDHKKSQRQLQQQANDLAAARRELEALRAASNKVDPKVAEDEFFGGPTGFIDKRFGDFEKRFEAKLAQERLESSLELAKAQYDDYEDVEAAFIEAAQKDPSLFAQIRGSRQPAIAAYKIGKKILAGAESAPESRIAKLEAEIAELRAGRDGGQTGGAAETAAAPVQKPSVPRSNAGSRGAGVGKTSSFAGPTPLNKVFGRQRQAAR